MSVNINRKETGYMGILLYDPYSVIRFCWRKRNGVKGVYFSKSKKRYTVDFKDGTTVKRKIF